MLPEVSRYSYAVHNCWILRLCLATMNRCDLQGLAWLIIMHPQIISVNGVRQDQSMKILCLEKILSYGTADQSDLLLHALYIYKQAPYIWKFQLSKYCCGCHDPRKNTKYFYNEIFHQYTCIHCIAEYWNVKASRK